jgi:outer membrane protein OmpA-like peptidoglycan-associated protein
MKNLKSYTEFQDNQVDESLKDYMVGGLAAMGTVLGSPEQSKGQEINPIQMGETKPIPTQKDLLGNDLKGPPSTITVSLGNHVYLQTAVLRQSAEKEGDSKLFIEKHNEMVRRGFTLVWDSTRKKPKTWELKFPPVKKPIEIKSDTGSLFELGGWLLKNSVKKNLESQIIEIGPIDSIEIESSTDKTPLTQSLKKNLKSRGYSPDNSGLSKARSESIKSFLDSIGVDISKVSVKNLNDQGKDGGYDPPFRYVKIKINPVSKDYELKKSGDENKDEIIYYYQKIVDRKKGADTKKEYRTRMYKRGDQCPPGSNR